MLISVLKIVLAVIGTAGVIVMIAAYDRILGRLAGWSKMSFNLVATGGRHVVQMVQHREKQLTGKPGPKTV
jgi:hypothetical protein